MASAIVLGAVDSGVLDPSRCIVADPNSEKRGRFARSAETAESAIRAAVELEKDGEPQDRAAVMLAVKPQMLAGVAAEIAPVLGEVGRDRLFISILGGTTTVALGASLGAGARVVRVMPNTPVRLRCGVSSVTPGASATAEDTATVRALFEAVGEVVQLEESRIDAFTAIAGSGPAYVFYLAEAMLLGARQVGIDDAQADRLVRQTILGAARLLDSQRGTAPVDLRAAVTSRNGITAAATGVFDQGEVLSTISCGIVAARDRSQEIAEETGGAG